MNKRVHLFISGRVQGVCFRAYTEDEGKRLNLTGWVRNRPDGRVEIVAEGKEEMLERLISWSHRGSPYSSVDDVEVNWENYQDEFNQFTINWTTHK